MKPFMTTAELADEAMKALRESREPSREHFARLVRLGWINRQGEVTRLLGGDAEPEPDSDRVAQRLLKRRSGENEHDSRSPLADQAFQHWAHSRTGMIAMIRKGAPVPPAIFMGRAMTVQPISGSASKLARFSKTGTLCANSLM